MTSGREPHTQGQQDQEGDRQAARPATKVYVVKSGDTLSGIAGQVRHERIGDLEELNPDIDFSTLVVGEKIKVPKPY